MYFKTEKTTNNTVWTSKKMNEKYDLRKCQSEYLLIKGKGVGHQEVGEIVRGSTPANKLYHHEYKINRKQKYCCKLK